MNLRDAIEADPVARTWEAYWYALERYSEKYSECVLTIRDQKRAWIWACRKAGTIKGEEAELYQFEET